MTNSPSATIDVQIDSPIWVLRKEKCNCCRGEGELAFSTCPNCHHVVLICTEVGTAFEICNRQPGPIIGVYGVDAVLCPKCGKASNSEFGNATSEEITALGFPQEDYR